MFFPVVQDMALDDVGGSLDADFSAVLALQSQLIVCLVQKQAHFITGAAVGIGFSKRELMVLKFAESDIERALQEDEENV